MQAREAAAADVWQPGRIGPLTLPHRIVMGSMHLGLEGLDADGRALAAFYRARAEGGAALIVTGGSAVSRAGAGGRNYSFVNDDADAAKLERVAAAVHDGGARVLLQLFHAGRYALEQSFGLTPVAPSAVYSAYSRCEPRALTGEEIVQTIEDFATGASRARELGFDGVEIMGSEGYLLSQFMAPATNLRDDEWGGCAERRMRFPLAVAEAVRSAGGPGQAVVYRLSGADLVPGGAPAEDVLALARALAARGLVDAINVGIGWHEARVPTVQATVPKAAWAPWARAVREVVAVPVIASNRINTVALAAEVVAAGGADFVSMARPFLADPEIVAKSRAGRSPVNVCIACNQCIDNSIFDRRVSCVVNPRAGFEAEGLGRASARPPSRRAAVAVVGGGPAGMEAARSLAAAGYSVTLFEATGRLGGQFRMACRIPGKEDFERTIEYFEHELAALGVAVSLEARVPDARALSGFDAVVVATGVRPREVALPGAGLPHVRSYASVLLDEGGAGSCGDSVAIIGAGGIGVDVAHLLGVPRDGGDPIAAFHGRYGLRAPQAPVPVVPKQQSAQRAVTLMRRGQRIGAGIGPSTRWVALQELERAGVRLLPGVRYERISPGSVDVVTAEGEALRVPAATVVIAAGQEPETALLSELTGAGAPVVAVGGAAGADGLDAGRAFREGFEAPAGVARALARRA